MSKTYAIVENGIVVNVIIADEDFVNQFHPDSAHPYEEIHEDDTKVARIGDTFDPITKGFITPPTPTINVTTLNKAEIMLRLKAMNLWTQFNALLASQSDENDFWTLSNDITIDSKFITNVFPAIGIPLDKIQDFYNQPNLS